MAHLLSPELENQSTTLKIGPKSLGGPTKIEYLKYVTSCSQGMNEVFICNFQIGSSTAERAVQLSTVLFIQNVMKAMVYAQDHTTFDMIFWSMAAPTDKDTVHTENALLTTVHTAQSYLFNICT